MDQRLLKSHLSFFLFHSIPIIRFPSLQFMNCRLFSLHWWAQLCNALMSCKNFLFWNLRVTFSSFAMNWLTGAILLLQINEIIWSRLIIAIDMKGHSTGFSSSLNINFRSLLLCCNTKEIRKTVWWGLFWEEAWSSHAKKQTKHEKDSQVNLWGVRLSLSIKSASDLILVPFISTSTPSSSFLTIL